MASINDTTINFASKATISQIQYVLSLYNDVFKLHAEKTRGSKQNELIKLDNWYQNELPKLIKTRKEPHISYSEIVQIAKWKLLRGKFRPGILDLVKTNTETVVKTSTKKAFKKMPNISSAISALTKVLKGIAPATASAILVAYSPEECPFFFDESMVCTPGIENTDTFTTTEYLNYCEKIKSINEKLKNSESKELRPHDIELAIWTHYHIKKYDLNLLDNMPIDELNNKIELNDNQSSQDNLDDNLKVIENTSNESQSNGLSTKESNNQLNEISNQSSLSNLSTNSTNKKTNGDLNKTEFSILEDNNSNSFVSSNSINDEQSNESSQLNKLISIDKEDSLSNNVSSTNGISENEISTSSKLNGDETLTKSNNEINLKTTITTNSQQHFKITTTTNNIDSNLSNSLQLNTDSSEMKFNSTISSSSCDNSNNINSSEDSIQLNKRKNSSSNSSLVSNLSNLKSSKTSISNQLNINLDDNAIFDPDSDQPLSKRQKIN